MPLAAALFLLGVVKGGWNVLGQTPPNLKDSDLVLLVAGVQVFALALIADLISKRR